MDKFKRFLPSLIFNVAETIIIALMGTLLDVPINYIILVMLSFMITRFTLGKGLHFKTWYRCFIWSTLIMLSLFVWLHVDLAVSITFAIFAAFILTGKSNIDDMYLWKNNNEPGKYQDIVDFITYNSFDDRLIEFEKKLKYNNLEYLIYKYRFKDFKTFNEIEDMLHINGPRLVEHLDKISFAIRLYCGI